MLPLLAEATPTTVTEFTEALRRGLERDGLTTREVLGEGAAFPTLEKLRIDLTDTQLTRAYRPSKLPPGGRQEVPIAHFELLGAPVYFERAPLEVRLVAEGVKAAVAMGEGTGGFVLESAAAGDVSLQTTRAALETLLHALAVEAAAKQGLEVKKTSLQFTQEGPRVVSFRVEVTVKVFVMSAVLALTGQFTIDEALNARLSNLALDGDGMILKLAGSYARPHLDRLEGRVFPLLALTPDVLKLRDVELTAGETLRVRAQFGAA
jgi:hypothetical protein